MSETNIHPIFDRLVTKNQREQFLNQHAAVFWLTGLSGSGKSTIASGVESLLFEKGFLVQVIDGDNMRTGLCSDLGFSQEDRHENIRRVAEVSKLFIHAGIITICSFISPTNKIRKMAKEIVGAHQFHEIYIESSLEVCEKRDVKGLYAKARKGIIKGFTGIDSPYENPGKPALVINSSSQSVQKSTLKLYSFILQQVSLSS